MKVLDTKEMGSSSVPGRSHDDHDHALPILEEQRSKQAQVGQAHAHAGHVEDAGRAHHLSHGHHGRPAAGSREPSNLRLAVMATLHCLVGCGIGEIVGVVIGTALGWGMWQTMGLAVALGFVFGFGLGVLPLLQGGMAFRAAFKVILVSEGLSIAVMEAAEVSAQILIPGVMEAGLTDALFWTGMGIALVAGFVAALPVNIVMIRRGIRHVH